MKSAIKNEYFSKYLNRINEHINSVEVKTLMNAVALFEETHRNSGKAIFVGNGGSAAMASHLSVDFTKTAGIRAVNFNEADLITCFANDYGYENWVSKALEAYADKGDLVILFSSSGKSANILNAAKQARNMGIKVITASGFSAENPLAKLGDINFWVNSSSYNIIEMAHHIWFLAINDFLVESGARH